MKLLTVIAIAFLLPGCLGKRAADAESNYKTSYGGYLISQSDCMELNKNKVEVPQTEGDPIKIEFAAGGCDAISKPQHGGEYVAQAEAAYINAGSTLLGAAVTGAYGYAINKDNNETRVDLSELQNQRLDSNNTVLIRSIESSQQSSQAATDAALGVATLISDQSQGLTDLIESLTQPEEPVEGEPVE